MRGYVLRLLFTVFSFSFFSAVVHGQDLHRDFNDRTGRIRSVHSDLNSEEEWQDSADSSFLRKQKKGPKESVASKRIIHTYLLRTGKVTTIPNGVDSLPNFTNYEPSLRHYVGTSNTGIIGGGYLPHNYFKQLHNRDYIFLSPYRHHFFSPDLLRYYNTTTPLSYIEYHAGWIQNPDDMNFLNALFTQNINPKWNLAGRYRIFSSNGLYSEQSIKNQNFALWSSYLGERYTLRTGVWYNSLVAFENGGLEHDSLLKESGGLRIQTRLEEAYNEMYQLGAFAAHSLSMGKRLDSTGRLLGGVSSIRHMLRVERNRRFFQDTGFIALGYPIIRHDSNRTMEYTGTDLVENRFSLIRPEVAGSTLGFGIEVFGAATFRSNYSRINNGNEQSENFLDVSVGGAIYQRKNKYFEWEAMGEVFVSGYYIGGFEGEAQIKRKFSVLGDTASILLDGKLINERPNYYLAKFPSNHFQPDQQLALRQEIRGGGTLELEKLGLRLRGDFGLVRKHTYIMGGKVFQYDDPIVAFALKAKHSFRWWIFGMTNRLLYQENSAVGKMPVPRLSLYNSTYFDFVYARLLRVHFGVKLRYFTPFYAPIWNPALGLFEVQKADERVNVGNYPLMDVFFSLHMGRARFYFMWVNLTRAWVSPDNMFESPHVPMTPMSGKLGVSWYFND